MKTRHILLFFFIICSSASFGQDTTYKPLSKVTVNKNGTFDTAVMRRKPVKLIFNKKQKMYRPTRLGSSSPKYDTYQKNKRGAGAVTTNPNKGSGSYQPIAIDSTRSGMNTTDSSHVASDSSRNQ